MENKVETLDLTPSWPEALNVCLLLLEAGTSEGKKTAKEQLLKMAELAQKFVDVVKLLDEWKNSEQEKSYDIMDDIIAIASIEE